VYIVCSFVVMQSWIFSIITHTPVFSATWSTCWFGAQETFIIITIIIHFKISSAALYFFGNCDTLPFKSK